MKYSKLAAWAGALGVFVSAAVGVSAVTQEQPEAISKAIRKQMDRQFAEWAVVGAPTCAGASNPTVADIDFDQSPDVAMVVRTDGGEPHVVIAMPRVLGGAIVHDLGPLSAIPGATHLVVLPQGRVVSEAGAMLVDYLSGPTFAAASCEGPLVAFVWTGYGFRRVTVA